MTKCTQQRKHVVYFLVPGFIDYMVSVRLIFVNSFIILVLNRIQLYEYIPINFSLYYWLTFVLIPSFSYCILVLQNFLLRIFLVQMGIEMFSEYGIFLNLRRYYYKVVVPIYFSTERSIAHPHKFFIFQTVEFQSSG